MIEPGASFIGIDLAWSPQNSTGVAALVPDGDRLQVAESGIRISDDEIVGFVDKHLAPTTIVMIDSPLVLPFSIRSTGRGVHILLLV